MNPSLKYYYKNRNKIISKRNEKRKNAEYRQKELEKQREHYQFNKEKILLNKKRNRWHIRQDQFFEIICLE